jgi:hypothetical protein
MDSEAFGRPERRLGAPMDTIFRLKKSYRNLAMTCLLFFLGMMVFSFSVALYHSSILGSLGLAVFWGFWVVLSVMLLLSYYRCCDTDISLFPSQVDIGAMGKGE